MTNSRVDKMGDDSALQRSLREKNDYFKKMVNLIPAKYYLDKETKKAGEKFYKNIKEEAPRQEFKDKSTKQSRKKQRMDPGANQQLKVTDLQDALAVKEAEREKRRQEKIKQEEEVAEELKAEEDKDEESSGDEMDGFEGGLQGLGDSDDKDWSQRKVAQPVSVERIQSSASIDDLRRKVQDKIEQMRQQRHAKSLAGNALMSKKMSKKVKEENEKKLRKQETYEAIKASKEQKRKEKERQRTVNGGGNKEDAVDAQEGEDEVPGPSKVSFSKFDFEEESRGMKKGGKKKKKKRKAGEEKLSGRDYEGLLKKVKAKKQKIAEVKKSNPDAAEEMIKQDKWRAALDRAEGKKVRDDPELLKKSIRKKKEKKKHSENKWKERKERTKELMAERQKKRKTNLKGRKDALKTKKVKRLQKKGKLLLKDSDYS
ncbi:ribosomal RNA-processing protein 14-C-like [Patiria miniata]|uniref:Surfeit locus protein 6 n=1 Tax=Patiria miniata TaxID=46514 RepID=A0A914AHN6_PATMI|nr:ribosomal RNA-processing protein 14-C-like [Patiria miniata]XP_038063511.1 ribosomal RNA-processing protein 14-C-like [Patiria miniata]